MKLYKLLSVSQVNGRAVLKLGNNPTILGQAGMGWARSSGFGLRFLLVLAKLPAALESLERVQTGTLNFSNLDFLIVGSKLLEALGLEAQILQASLLHGLPSGRLYASHPPHGCQANSSQRGRKGVVHHAAEFCCIMACRPSCSNRQSQAIEAQTTVTLMLPFAGNEFFVFQRA